MKPPAKTPPTPLRIRYKQQALQPGPVDPRALAAHAGVSTGTLRTISPMACVAPVMVDGGTRFALEVDPTGWLPAPEGWAGPRPPDGFVAIVDALRAPSTRIQDAEERQRGGCVVRLPLSNGEHVHARAEIRGTRREQLTLYFEDLAFVRIGLESGQVRMELKAKGLWAEGYGALAARMLDRVLWWTTGLRCTLATAHDPAATGRYDAPAWEHGGAPLGWRMTGLEICSDFVGMEFAEADMSSFVGFKAAEIIRTFVRDGELETLNLGTRASPISLCIYDKTEQVDVVKNGDDSTYRAAWNDNGWDGQAPIRRVEFRVTGRALKIVHTGTGEVLDFTNPALLADRAARAQLWAALCSGKRLIVRENATRVERCDLDQRWLVVIAASKRPFSSAYRQHRTAQRDTWREAESRARRDLLRAASRFAALHDQTDLSPALAMRFALSTSSAAQLAAATAYALGYRHVREESIGREIVEIGLARWNLWSGGRTERQAGDDDPHHVGHRRRMPLALQGST